MPIQKNEYWLALHAAFGGTAAAGEFLRKQLNTDLLFGAGLTPPADLSPTLAAGLRQAREALPRAKEALRVCQNAGWTVITPDNVYYPDAFRALKDPPLALFAAGDPAHLLGRNTAAVVGTRKPAPQSVIAAYLLAQAFSQQGVVTVSGGALGIDSAAHEGALSGPGVTVAVLGNGLGHKYLAEKAFMRRRIEKQGLLLTERFPMEAPTPTAFPRRNRLIAVLGRTLTVVQSELKGGSMISAQYARVYGHPMFVLSGRVFYSPGCEKLIADGAKPIADAADVLGYYGIKHVCAPLENDGAAIPKVLDPKACTLQEFAELNGVTPGEAKALYESLIAREAGSSPRPVPQAKPSPPPAPSPLEQAALKARIAQENGLEGDLREVFLALEDTPTGLDDLALRTSLTPSQVMTAVTMLELQDLATTLPGDRVVIKN